MLTPPESFHISSFDQIGFHDPFPKEDNKSDFTLPESHTTNTTNEISPGTSQNQNQSPMLRYFPSKIIMFKIMRACIDVEDTEDLWYMQLQRKIVVSANAKKKRAMMKRSTILSDDDMSHLTNKIESEVVKK